MPVGLRNSEHDTEKMAKKYHIGTSGWHYDHWEGPFYPEGTSKKERLCYYTSVFDTVEINNSFYQLPSENTFENWYQSTPDNFIFSVKANRYITHMKNLMDVEEPIDKFISRCKLLREKLGGMLFQLPPQWNIDVERFRKFADLLPNDLRITVEFRNETWFSEKIYEILRDENISFCIFELGEKESPILTTADFVYIRLHGPSGPYQGDYSKDSLKTWAVRINNWLSDDKEVYLYFDNDQKGYAPKNAQEIEQIIKQATSD